MSIRLLFSLFAACCLLVACMTPAFSSDAPTELPDPYLEYEKGDTPEVADWVKAENARTGERLAESERYRDFRRYLLANLNADDRIVYPSFYWGSDLVRNFWRDEEHPQGIIRETTVDGFMSRDYRWQTVLDLDALSKAEGKTWVYGGVSYPYRDNRVAMIRLSDGGKDATVIREFDYEKRCFVEDGFSLPESKSDAVWLDRDTLLISSAVAEEERTESGYPRVVKKWRRGTPFSEAETVFSGEVGDLAVGAGLLEIDDGVCLPYFVRSLDFYHSERFILDGDAMRRLDIPGDARIIGIYRRLAFLWLKSDWRVGDRVWKEGSVVYCPFEQLTASDKDVALFYQPEANSAFSSLSVTRRHLYLNILEDVQTKVFQCSLADGEWRRIPVPVGPMTTGEIGATPDDKPFVMFMESGFLNPTRLYRIDADSLERTLVQSLPERFDSSGYQAEQFFAESADGTRVPYFMVHRKDMALDGDNPVLQYGYGGFLESELPYYLVGPEYCWLRPGGVYVVANIRGGGEYGPAWHEQARGVGRSKSFEDFIAVSEDLVKRGVTSPAHLGIQGGSNGGLLTGAVMVLRPDLYNAAVINVPLLDMLRYHLLPPGPSWTGEYGNPEDPEVRAFWERYSPYRNLREGVGYPAPFIATSSKDDRVHPGHARKFAKRLEQFGQDFYYYEETEGGHSGNANNEQIARTTAMVYEYLWTRLR